MVKIEYKLKDEGDEVYLMLINSENKRCTLTKYNKEVDVELVIKQVVNSINQILGE